MLIGSNSQCGQESFAFFTSGHRKFGSYLEIGAGDWLKLSNTYILENKMKWKGVSLEIQKKLANNFNKYRSNPCLAIDALTADYSTILSKYNLPKFIDYLSVDIEPAENSLAALKSIPFETYSFGFITFEHDLNVAESNYKIQAESRQFLLNHGYLLYIPDIKLNGKSFEDWFIHPKVSASLARFKLPKKYELLDGNELFTTRSRIRCQLYHWINS
jgi:hypothetical protein